MFPTWTVMFVTFPVSKCGPYLKAREEKGEIMWEKLHDIFPRMFFHWNNINWEWLECSIKQLKCFFWYAKTISFKNAESLGEFSFETSLALLDNV